MVRRHDSSGPKSEEDGSQAIGHSVQCVWDTASLSRASEFGCDFRMAASSRWISWRTGSHTGGKWAKCQVGLSPTLATPCPAFAEFTFPGRPHLKFRD
jgi:hypothetical protein